MSNGRLYFDAYHTIVQLHLLRSSLSAINYDTMVFVWLMVSLSCYIRQNTYQPSIECILPKRALPAMLTHGLNIFHWQSENSRETISTHLPKRMADRALLTRYPRYVEHSSSKYTVPIKLWYTYGCLISPWWKYIHMYPAWYVPRCFFCEVYSFWLSACTWCHRSWFSLVRVKACR